MLVSSALCATQSVGPVHIVGNPWWLVRVPVGLLVSAFPEPTEQQRERLAWMLF